MKIIISESQREFIRRYEQIKDIINQAGEELREQVCDFTFGDFVNETCWLVSDNRDDFGFDEPENYEIWQEQTDEIHKWIVANFKDYLTEIFEKLVKEENCLGNFDVEDDLSSFLYGVDNNQ